MFNTNKQTKTTLHCELVNELIRAEEELLEKLVMLQWHGAKVNSGVIPEVIELLEALGEKPTHEVADDTLMLNNIKDCTWLEQKIKEAKDIATKEGARYGGKYTLVYVNRTF